MTPVCDDDCQAFSIEAVAVADASCAGFRARVVVRQQPTQRELFRDEFGADGDLPWSQPEHARAAAIRRAQHFVRRHLRDCAEQAFGARRERLADDRGARARAA